MSTHFPFGHNPEIERRQFDLDFSGRLPVSAQEGMARADEHADARWKRVVDGCILAVAKRQEFFTVDDVLAELESLPDPPDTHNLGALGPRMKEVSKTLGYMEATSELRRSRRPEKNGNLHRVWRSKVLGGAR